MTFSQKCRIMFSENGNPCPLTRQTEKEVFSMTFDEILAAVREKAASANAGGTDFLAAQINLSGNNGGVFYVEVKDGRIAVEPYEYNDRSCAVSMSADDFVKLMNGKLDAVAAFTLGKLKVDGDISKALEFAKIVK